MSQGSQGCRLLCLEISLFGFITTFLCVWLGRMDWGTPWHVCTNGISFCLPACLPVSLIHYTLTLAELLKRQERERMYFNKTESRCTALGTSSKFREAFCELSGSTLQLRTLTNIHLYPPPPLTHLSPPPRLTYLSRNRKLGTGLRFQCCEAFRRTGSRGLPTTSQLALRKAGLTSQLEEGDKFIIRTGNPP